VAAAWFDVGWAGSDHVKRKVAVDALRRALAAGDPVPDLVHHVDHGSQYSLVDYQVLPRKRGILISMCGKANCCDNASEDHGDIGSVPRREVAKALFKGNSGIVE
jgi:transposase InsO family protein